MSKKSNFWVFIPIMLAFFAMGAVDLVGIASNYVKKDLQLSDTVANLMPSMVFLWFFIFSVPTGLLMNRIGRHKTVLISLIITVLALLTPLAGDSFAVILISFSLLGIGNTVMQVSLNPLISNVVSSDKFASTLTFGQFVKAIASFAAPFVAAYMALRFGDWKLLFPIYSSCTLLALALLSTVKITEQPVAGKSNFGKSLSLLGKTDVLLFFLGIMAHVGIDVGVNATAPKILMERIGGMTLDSGGMFGGAGVATSVYFMFRLAGCLLGTVILAKYKHIRFWYVSVAAMALAAAGFFCVANEWLLYACLALIGFGNSNIFPMIFSRAVQCLPERSNEISGLMIMGVSGGAVFPLLMGIMSDFVHAQWGAIIVIAALIAYLFCISRKHVSPLQRLR
jgi:fucose permease